MSLVQSFSESLCSKDRGGTSRNTLDLAFSVQRLSENSVIVRPAFRQARSHRRDRLGTIHGLALLLLVDAQHHGPLRGVQVRPHDVAHFRYELRVLGQFERFVPVQLEPKRLLDPCDSCRTQAALGSHRARAPVCGCARQRLQRFDHHAFDFGVPDLARGSRLGLVQQAYQALAPLAEVARVVPSSAAEALSLRPVALHSTIRARRSKAWEVLDRRTPRSSSLQSPEARSGGWRVRWSLAVQRRKARAWKPDDTV